jgi:O-acetyl-ADP-ribose deacetylase (regulator of RNase III)
MLKCRAIVHAVTPMYRDGHHHEEDLFKESLLRALQTADAQNMRSVAVYSIGSCSYNFPKDHCASLLFEVLLQFLPTCTNVTKVSIVNSDSVGLQYLEEEFDRRVPKTGPCTLTPSGNMLPDLS